MTDFKPQDRIYSGSILAPTESEPLERTDDVVTRVQLIETIGHDDDSPLPDTIGVCAGEWRVEPDGDHWRFFADKNWAD